MHYFEDETVLHLYLLIKDSEEPLNEVQHEAVDFLVKMAQQGSDEAATALHDLAQAPQVHPLLREEIRATPYAAAR